MSLRITAGRSLIWSAAERWGAQLLGVAVFTVLVRLLDKPAFGIVALANLYIGFVQILVDQGIGVAIVQRKNLDASHLDTAFWMNVGVALALAGTTVALSRPAAVFLGSEDVGPVLAWLALALPLAALSIVPSALLTRELRFKLLAVRSLTAAAVAGGAAIGAALLGFGVWSLVLQQLVGAGVSLALLWSTVPWKPGFRPSRSALTDLAPFSANVIGNNVLWFVSQRVDQGVIGRGLGVEALGAYSVSLRLVNLGFEGMTEPVARIAMPLFSGIQSETERLMRAFLRSTSLVCSVALPAFLGLLLVGPNLIPLVFGQKWEAAIVPMQILCVGGCVRAVQTFVHPTIMALGRAGLYTSLFALYAAVSATGCWMAAGHGVAPVAWAVVIAGGVTGVANVIVLSRLLRFSLLALAEGLWPILAACGFLALAVVGADRALSGHVHDLVTVATQVTAGAVAYAASMALMARGLLLELWNTAKRLSE